MHNVMHSNPTVFHLLAFHGIGQAYMTRQCSTFYDCRYHYRTSAKDETSCNRFSTVLVSLVRNLRHYDSTRPEGISHRSYPVDRL